LIQYAVLGLGRLGSRHADILAGRVEGARVAAVADPAPGRAAEIGRRIGATPYTDPMEAIHHQGVDAVVVVTPTDTHAMYCVEAARARKQIFCEKPLAPTMAEAERLAAAVERAGVLFQIGFMRRLDPAYRKARQLIDEGRLGRVIHYTGLMRDPGAPPVEYLKASGGIFMDQLIHEFDIARFLVGSEVERVIAHGRDVAHGFIGEMGDADQVHVILDFENGALGHLEGSRNSFYGYDIRGELMGTEGTIQFGYLQQTPLVLLNRSGASHDLVQTFLQRFDQAYTDELIEFNACVREGRRPSPGVRDGIEAQRLASAATESFRRQAPVRVHR
jgi:scyllo-inositol 2-dehydrogenase (NAD+)